MMEALLAGGAGVHMNHAVGFVVFHHADVRVAANEKTGGVGFEFGANGRRIVARASADVCDPNVKTFAVEAQVFVRAHAYLCAVDVAEYNSCGFECF